MLVVNKQTSHTRPEDNRRPHDHVFFWRWKLTYRISIQQHQAEISQSTLQAPYPTYSSPSKPPHTKTLLTQKTLTHTCRTVACRSPPKSTPSPPLHIPLQLHTSHPLAHPKHRTHQAPPSTHPPNNPTDQPANQPTRHPTPSLPTSNSIKIPLLIPQSPPSQPHPSTCTSAATQPTRRCRSHLASREPNPLGHRVPHGLRPSSTARSESSHHTGRGRKWQVGRGGVEAYRGRRRPRSVTPRLGCA